MSDEFGAGIPVPAASLANLVALTPDDRRFLNALIASAVVHALLALYAGERDCFEAGDFDAYGMCDVEVNDLADAAAAELGVALRFPVRCASSPELTRLLVDAMEKGRC
ncbi:MAG: hypothetical protein WDN08_05480 [Rhizomicrobium sp.]